MLHAIFPFHFGLRKSSAVFGISAAHESGVDRGREEILQDRVPAAVGVLQLGGIFSGVRRHELFRQPGLEQRRRGVDAVEHVGLRAAGARLVHDLDRVRPAVSACVFHLDAGIFLVEGRDHWAHGLIDDQRRVPAAEIAMPDGAHQERHHAERRHADPDLRN